jgi:regulator of protease activity HflC (stomatin/prohibitin superfamily)
MNFSRSIILFNKNIRTIATVYDLEPVPGPGAKQPARTIYKTLDPTIKKDDLVIIPTDTRYKMSVVKVVETDVEIEDFDAPGDIKWIIDKVNRESFDKSLAMEQTGIEMMRSAEKRRRREEIQAAILKDNPDFANLAIVKADTLLIDGAVQAPPEAPLGGAVGSTYDPNKDPGVQF